MSAYDLKRKMLKPLMCYIFAPEGGASRQSLRPAMKLLQVISSDGTRLYGAMIRKQAEIRRNGRGTFLRARARKRNAAKWTHVRYKGSINFEPGPSEAVEVAIQSPDRGDEARLLSSFLGWLDRHFGEQLSSIKIEYQQAATSRRHRR
jgi:hypothetical protein